jgi:hypothetical protein
MPNVPVQYDGGRIPPDPRRPICRPLQVRSLPRPDLFSLYSNLCSPLGRGYPDIAAQAEDFQFVFRNVDPRADGTASAVSVRVSLLPALPLCVVHSQAPS